VSGVGPAIGLTFMGLGFMVIPGFILYSIFTSWRRQKNWLPQEGTIEELEAKTSTSSSGGVGSSSTRSRSRTSLIAHYRYRAQDGSEHTGSGRLTSQRFGFDDEERRIDILVDPMDQSRSVVTGSSASPGSLGCFLVFSVPFLLIGVVLFLAGIGMIAGA
jgi:hypothetical protein